MAINHVLAMYCTRAIRETATKKLAVKPFSIIFTGDPSVQLTIVAVMKVEVARIAELKRIVLGRLLIFKVAQTPSNPDTKTAAAPPYSNSVKKTKVSATVIRPLTLGILMAMSELAPTIKQRKKKGASSPWMGSWYSEIRMIT